MRKPGGQPGFLTLIAKLSVNGVSMGRLWETRYGIGVPMNVLKPENAEVKAHGGRRVTPGGRVSSY